MFESESSTYYDLEANEGCIAAACDQNDVDVNCSKLCDTYLLKIGEKNGTFKAHPT